MAAAQSRDAPAAGQARGAPLMDKGEKQDPGGPGSAGVLAAGTGIQAT